MANEKTLNDLILQVQATNIRLEALADSGNKQETHLATLAKASKGDKLQDLEDKREANKKSPTSGGSNTVVDKKEKGGGLFGNGLLMRSAMMAGIMSLLTAAFAGIAGLFTVAGLAAAGIGLLKGGLAAGLLMTITAVAIRAITNYLGVTDVLDKAIDELMSGKVSAGSMGLVFGAGTGALAGFAIGGPFGAIVGAMIGGATMGVIAALGVAKFDASNQEMKDLMFTGLLGVGLFGLLGAGLGAPFGPLGIIGGLILGMAVGALITYLIDFGLKAIRGINFSEIIGDAVDAITKFFSDIIADMVSFFDGDGELNKRLDRVSRKEWNKQIDEQGMTNAEKFKDTDENKSRNIGAFNTYLSKGDDSFKFNGPFNADGTPYLGDVRRPDLQKANDFANMIGTDTQDLANSSRGDYANQLQQAQMAQALRASIPLNNVVTNNSVQSSVSHMVSAENNTHGMILVY